MFKIGNLTLNSPLLLAPMAGITDLPYRMTVRPFGCSLAFTEMVSTNSLAYKSKNALQMICSQPEDRPLGVQLLGDDDDSILRSLENLPHNRFDLIDFNAACPVNKVATKGRGAGLLKDPEKLHGILKLIVNNTDLPVTIKIRSGWDSTSVNAAEVAKSAQDAGAKCIFIHGRTRAQKYKGKVDYDHIRVVKKSVSIPVVASGDGLSPYLIKRMFDQTGCDGVAIARGALGNPWLFPETVEYMKTGIVPPRPGIEEVTQTMRKHLLANIEFSGEMFGVIRFRKFYGWYVRGLPARELKIRAFFKNTKDEMMAMIDELYDHVHNLDHTRDLTVYAPITS
ncbi:MAG: tRNA dihydrouridine synthase DusB [Nitrospiraceae bacterium]|nr:MAG: tRNA dihydrouridine synthase DusB [Nitrospiraceae bacterium]